MNLVAIPPHSVGVMWPRVSPGIEKMVERGIGITTAHDIKCEALSGRWMLFIVEDQGATVVTAICAIEQGDKKVFTIVGAWGVKMSEWVEQFYDSMVQVATDLGCDSISITGRRGWVKYLKDRGFTERMVTVVKELK